MKKVFWFLSVSFLSVSSGYSQNNDDNTYYSNNDNQYNNNYDNGYNQNHDYNNNNGDQSYNNNSSDEGYQAFYEQLSPYGNWVDYGRYGYVWVPNQVDANFSPYNTAGHWVYSDYGWTWVSDYSWGWAPFHYGRWFQDASYGWMWMPGSEWAPAWVTWGNYNGYYCWAPVAPYAELNVYYRPEARYWNFVPYEHITQVNLGVYIDRNICNRNNVTVVSHNINIINQCGSYNNHTYFAGPRRADVEHVTHRTVEPVRVTTVNHAVNTQVSHNEMSIYRPEIRRTSQPAQQFHQQGSVVPNRVNIQNNNMQRNNFANNNRVEQYSPATHQNMNTVSRNNNVQPERQQQFSQPVRQNTPERSFNQSQPQQQVQQRNNFQFERQQQPAQPQRQAAPERSFNQSQPQQRQMAQSNFQPQRQQFAQPVRQSAPERNFASAQHAPQQSMQSSRPAVGGQNFSRGRR